MFHSRNLNNKINRIHEWALRLVYQDNLSFSELLNLDNSVTVHQKNLQVLVTEIYKVKNGIAPEIMKDIFELQNPSYNLRSSCNQFRRQKIKTVPYGLQSIRYIGPKNPQKAHEFSLTNAQISKRREAFANNSSANIKLSKSQLQKIGRSEGF